MCTPLNSRLSLWLLDASPERQAFPRHPERRPPRFSIWKQEGAPMNTHTFVASSARSQLSSAATHSSSRSSSCCLASVAGAVPPRGAEGIPNCLCSLSSLAHRHLQPVRVTSKARSWNQRGRRGSRPPSQTLYRPARALRCGSLVDASCSRQNPRYSRSGQRLLRTRARHYFVGPRRLLRAPVRYPAKLRYEVNAQSISSPQLSTC